MLGATGYRGLAHPCSSFHAARRAQRGTRGPVVPAAPAGRELPDIAAASGASDRRLTSDEVDIKRLICCVQELQDKVKALEGELAADNQRELDRMVAIKALIKESLAQRSGPVHGDRPGAEGAPDADEEVGGGDHEDKWDSYRNSFTLLMSKGYLQTAEQLRDRLMSSEWELELRPLAMRMGVSRFEAYCAENGKRIDFATVTALYEDPSSVEVVEDEELRLKARSCIAAAEAEQRLECFHVCTAEARRLAAQFAEGEFISKLLPDPIEQGLVDSLLKVAIPMGKLLRHKK